MRYLFADCLLGSRTLAMRIMFRDCSQTPCVMSTSRSSAVEKQHLENLRRKDVLPRLRNDRATCLLRRLGGVSNVDMVTPIALIYKVLFSSISTFETPLTAHHRHGLQSCSRDCHPFSIRSHSTLSPTFHSVSFGSSNTSPASVFRVAMPR